jgi:transcription elongation factor GreA
LTPAKIQRLKDELEDLKRRRLPEAAEEVRRTAAMGDLSENAAYQYAKAELRRINARILSIEERLKSAILIVKPKDGVVAIGSTVTVETGGRRQTFEIVGAQETDPSRGRISHLSPIGKALIGHSVGDEVTINTTAGQTAYRIIDVG